MKRGEEISGWKSVFLAEKIFHCKQKGRATARNAADRQGRSDDLCLRSGAKHSGLAILQTAMHAKQARQAREARQVGRASLLSERQNFRALREAPSTPKVQAPHQQRPQRKARLVNTAISTAAATSQVPPSIAPDGIWHEQWAQRRNACGDLIRISCHHGGVPPEIGADMARLYGSLYSSVPLLQAYGHVGSDVHTFVMRKNGLIAAIFLYRLRASVMDVINEGMAVDQCAVDEFAGYAFRCYPQIGLIRFPSVLWQGMQAPRFLQQRLNVLENLVLTLPASTDAYRSSLGKNTRRNLKRYGERLLRDFPSYQFSVTEGGQARDEDIRAIINLNILRMRSKDKVSDYDEAEIVHIISLVRQCGLIGIATIDGRICAGAISFRTGDNYALSVLSHDPHYNDYSPGILCAFNMICECIARGAHEFNFLWGRYDYKFMLLAQCRDLDQLSVYRSWPQLLRHADIAVANQFSATCRKVRLWLAATGGDGHLPARIGNRLLKACRRARRMLGERFAN